MKIKSVTIDIQSKLNGVNDLFEALRKLIKQVSQLIKKNPDLVLEVIRINRSNNKIVLKYTPNSYSPGLCDKVEIQPYSLETSRWMDLKLVNELINAERIQEFIFEACGSWGILNDVTIYSSHIIVLLRLVGIDSNILLLSSMML